MNNLPRQALIVSHTHWDREWYLPFHRFRVNLVEVVGQVLDALENDPSFKHFVLDGQSILLEDYLEVMPDQKDRVRGLINRGALAVGPWYILPDEFLVSGEATVRNLIFGRKTILPYGRVQKVGYMPDSFGHHAQMPQILRLTGIDSFIFTRGLGDEASELGWLFRWDAPDGSDVLAVNQCDGYCNAGGLGLAELWHAHTRRSVDPELAVAKVGQLFEKMAGRGGAQPALLNNGCDHFPPQRNFGAVLEALRQAYPDTAFDQVRFEDFLKAARAELDDDNRPRWTGELLGGRDQLILSGVWSSRMYLKQQNEICQNLLSRLVEPLNALTTFHHGDPWPGGLLDAAWKELLRNHPHDSICGCSTDSVHKDMETRFAAVIQTGEQILSRLMDRLSPTFGRYEESNGSVVITVANPLPVTRNEVVERMVILPANGFDLDHLRLVDESGASVPLRIVERRFIERFWGIDYRSELFLEDQLNTLDTYLHRFGDRIIGSGTEAEKTTHDCFLVVQFLVQDLPAVGYRHYHLTDQPPTVGTPGPVFQPTGARMDGANAVLKNKYLEVELHPDGTLDLTDTICGRRFVGCNLLEDTEDTGDEYDYCPAETGFSVFSGGCEGKVKISDRSDFLVGAEVTFRFDLPRSLERDRKSRHPRTTPCDVTVRITLRSCHHRLDVETEINNRAFDHRLRVWFPTGLKTDTVTSDGHFMLNTRPLARHSSEAWAQPGVRTWPQQDWSALQDETGGLAIFNRGLPEFETWQDGDRGVVFALTLLRCVDWLSRDDLATRKYTNAGPTIHTPDAQCIGRQVFRYALAPFSGDILEADLISQSEAYRVPPVTGQGVADQMRPGGQSLVCKKDPRVVITAIKRAERGSHLIIRMANLSSDEVSEVLEFGLPVLDAEKANLLEFAPDLERDPVFVSDGGTKIKVPLQPYEIATVAEILADDSRLVRKPLVISTWNHGIGANEAAWDILGSGGRALDAVEKGVMVVEADPTITSVGYGGLPDRDGQVTLDACIMDSQGNAGAVCFLQNIKHPIGVARRVMEHTPHVMLAGKGARRFAVEQGFPEEDLLTDGARKAWQEWVKNKDYTPWSSLHDPSAKGRPDPNHDTISMIALDNSGRLSGSCTTSGLAFKMHGRVGDSPIIGASLFVDGEVGAACATGVGEEVMKTLGSFLIVELMRQGRSPEEACREAVGRILAKNPGLKVEDNLQVGYLAMDRTGRVGGYAILPWFQYDIHDGKKNRLVDVESYLS